LFSHIAGVITMSILSPEEFASIDIDNLIFIGSPEVEVSYDKRFDILSPQCRSAIADLFHGNIDAAATSAERAFQNFRRNPAWILELRAAAKRQFAVMP